MFPCGKLHVQSLAPPLPTPRTCKKRDGYKIGMVHRTQLLGATDLYLDIGHSVCVCMGTPTCANSKEVSAVNHVEVEKRDRMSIERPLYQRSLCLHAPQCHSASRVTWQQVTALQLWGGVESTSYHLAQAQKQPVYHAIRLQLQNAAQKLEVTTVFTSLEIY